MPVVKSKPITRRVEQVKPRQVFRVLNIKEFYEKRNKVLILRGVGGLGDIFMHRMMFEDFKRIMPDAEIHFACPRQYHDALRDHPFIDRILTIDEAKDEDYIVHYNTTTACGRYEMRLAPFSGDHRSDIWAAHCGVILTKHNMHIRLTDEEKAMGKDLLEKERDRPGPSVAIAPVSSMINKNLQEHQLLGLIRGLWDRGCYAVALHEHPIQCLLKDKIPQINGTRIRAWMSVLDQVDYVVAVDTAAFHCAGGMGKPMVGIFTFADGKVYGKYFDFLLVQRHRSEDPNWTCGPCYNWGNCPKTKEVIKPCLTEITPQMILGKVDMMMAKWPKRDSI